MITTPPCERLLVGVSGSFHSIALHEYLRLFRASFARAVRVIMTTTAAQVVNPRTIEPYTDDRVFIDIWDSSPSVRSPHIQLTRWAEMFVIVPATANILAKAAGGIADTLLSTAIVSSPRPVIFAPAMNPSMWSNRAVERNVEQLRADGHVVIEPIAGVSVTTGKWDTGLVPNPDLVLQHLMQQRMRALRAEYWDEARREPPRSPSPWRPVALATAEFVRDGGSRET